MIAIIDDLGVELKRLRAELVKAKEELDWYQRKLKEAQERNRKLDWCLTRTTEELLK
jgi:hypothetical protein